MLSSFPCIDGSVASICSKFRLFADDTSLSVLVDSHMTAVTKNQNTQIKLYLLVTLTPFQMNVTNN